MFMLRSICSWRWLCLAAVFVAVCLAGSSAADDKKDKKGKGQEYHGIVQIDLSRLPPDLAKQVLKYAKGKDKHDELSKHDKKQKWDYKDSKKKDHDRGRAPDLEQRLDRLLRELEDLRREIRRK